MGTPIKSVQNYYTHENLNNFMHDFYAVWDYYSLVPAGRFF
jgi:hypothetical protein